MRPDDARPGDASSSTRSAARTVVRRHATCVAVGEDGVLLLGPPGSGKSDLALRLIDGGASLVADDHVLIERRGPWLRARAPDAIRGLIEVRGLGILRLPSLAETRLSLAAELIPGTAGDRLPGPLRLDLAGVRLPLVRLDPSAPSAPAALRMALRAELVA